MKIIIIFLSFSILLCFYYAYADFRQVDTRLVYWNPAYIKDAHVVTGRRGHNDSYTNLTVTTLTPCGNNVSAAITLQIVSGGDFRLSHKLCDIMKEVWIINFLRAHSDVDTACPIPVGTYNVFNMVLPPRNMPIPMIASDYHVVLEMYATSNKEQILTVNTSLRYEEPKWKRPLN